MTPGSIKPGLLYGPMIGIVGSIVVKLKDYFPELGGLLLLIGIALLATSFIVSMRALSS